MAIVFSVFGKPTEMVGFSDSCSCTAITAGLMSYGSLAATPVVLFNQMFVIDPFTSFFTVLFMLIVVATVFGSIKYLDYEQLQYPEYYMLILFSATGMILMAGALDLMVLFIALELMSLTVDVLVGFRRADRKSNEASLKYFILGSTASAVLLYGIALIYGSTSTMNVARILEMLQKSSDSQSATYVLGMWLVCIGFLFKVASFPFHMWMPDVY